MLRVRRRRWCRHEQSDDALLQVIFAALAPEDRWWHSKGSPDQSPVVVVVRQSQSDGHGPARLPTPLGEVFDGEDARESEDGPGGADAELGCSGDRGSVR